MILGFSIMIIVSFSKMILNDVSCHKTFLGSEWFIFLSSSVVQSVLIIGSSIYLTKIKSQAISNATMEELNERKQKDLIEKRKNRYLRASVDPNGETDINDLLASNIGKNPSERPSFATASLKNQSISR
jgi:hypothetical protein